MRYGVFKPVASTPPPVSGVINLNAFGKSSMPAVNYVQQRSTATVGSVATSSFSASGGTVTRGTSGGGWGYNNQRVGIQTCCPGVPCNITASRIDQPPFIAVRSAMCPHTVHAAWDKPFCLTHTQISVPVTGCNSTAVADTYQLAFANVTPGPMCSVSGIRLFTVVGPNPIGPINPGQCLTVQGIIGRPPGFTQNDLTACYDVTVTGVSSALSVTERGSVQANRNLSTGSMSPSSDPIEMNEPPAGSGACRNPLLV